MLYFFPRYATPTCCAAEDTVAMNAAHNPGRVAEKSEDTLPSTPGIPGVSNQRHGRARRNATHAEPTPRRTNMIAMTGRIEICFPNAATSNK